MNTKKLTLAAVLTAIILLMGFTPLGYIKYGTIEITTMHIPVAIGSAVLGWRYGLYFGVMFGFTSLMQAFMGSPFGQLCLSMSVVYTIILCIVPRAIMGFLTGFAADFLRGNIHNSPVRNMIPCTIAPLANTVLFVGAFALFFGKNPVMTEAYGSVVKVITAFITLNAVLEIVACVVLGTAICTALDKTRLFEEKH